MSTLICDEDLQETNFAMGENILGEEATQVEYSTQEIRRDMRFLHSLWIPWNELPWAIEAFVDIDEIDDSRQLILYNTLKILAATGGIKLTEIEHFEDESRIVVSTVENQVDCFYALCMSKVPDYKGTWIERNKLKKEPWIVNPL